MFLPYYVLNLSTNTLQPDKIWLKSCISPLLSNKLLCLQQVYSKPLINVIIMFLGHTHLFFMHLDKDECQFLHENLTDQPILNISTLNMDCNVLVV